MYSESRLSLLLSLTCPARSDLRTHVYTLVLARTRSYHHRLAKDPIIGQQPIALLLTLYLLSRVYYCTC